MRVTGLGKLKNPEQYRRPDGSCIIGSSYEAKQLLKEFNPDLFDELGGDDLKIVPIMVKFKSMVIPECLYWAMLDDNGDIVFKTSAFDMFDYPQADVLKYKIIQEDTYIIFDDRLYRIVFTSNNEAIVKLPIGVWSEKAVVEVLDLRGHSNTKLCSINPVKLFDNSNNELICCCWAIEEEQCVYWYPMSFLDEVKLLCYDAENICEIVLNANDVIKVDKNTLVIKYSTKEGFYLEKSSMVIPFENFHKSRANFENNPPQVANGANKTARIVKLPGLGKT